MTRIISLKLFIAGTSVLISGCQPSKPDAPVAALPPTQEEAAAIVDKAESVWNSQDTAKIMALYAPGAVMFDPAVPEPSTDRAVQTKWTDVFTSMKLTGFHAPDRRVQIPDADTLIASGTGIFDSGIPGGPKTVSIRYTDVYQKQDDGTWLIIHEHLSDVPEKTPAD